MGKETAYILEKEGIYYSFSSEKSACDFLGSSKCCVASSYRRGTKINGYRIIKAISEWDAYYDKRLHKIWGSMHERCERIKHPYYDAYGGRGIKVCEEWREYLPFAKWAKNNGYTDNLTIDRIDVNGDYKPSNCRWTTMKEQQNNKRNNRVVTYHGENYTLTQLSEKTGIKKTTLKERLNLGWSIEDAVNRPVRQRTKGYRPSGARMVEPQERSGEE